MKNNSKIREYINSNKLDLEKIIYEYSGYVHKIIINTAGNILSNEDVEEIVSDTFFILKSISDYFFSFFTINCIFDFISTSNTSKVIILLLFLTIVKVAVLLKVIVIFNENPSESDTILNSSSWSLNSSIIVFLRRRRLL